MQYREHPPKLEEPLVGHTSVYNIDLDYYLTHESVTASCIRDIVGFNLLGSKDHQRGEQHCQRQNLL